MRYKLYQNKNLKSLAYGKWYARGLHEVMTFAEFVKHMAEHHCVYSEATIRGVLLEMEICLREQLLEGKAAYYRLSGCNETVGLMTMNKEDFVKELLEEYFSSRSPKPADGYVPEFRTTPRIQKELGRIIDIGGLDIVEFMYERGYRPTTDEDGWPTWAIWRRVEVPKET